MGWFKFKTHTESVYQDEQEWLKKLNREERRYFHDLVHWRNIAHRDGDDEEYNRLCDEMDRLFEVANSR